MSGSPLCPGIGHQSTPITMVKGKKKPPLLLGPLAKDRARDSSVLSRALLMHKGLSSLKWEVWEKPGLWTRVHGLCSAGSGGCSPLYMLATVFLTSGQLVCWQRLFFLQLTRKCCMSYRGSRNSLFPCFSLFVFLNLAYREMSFLMIDPNLLVFLPSPFSCPSYASSPHLLFCLLPVFLKPWSGDGCGCLRVLWRYLKTTDFQISPQTRESDLRICIFARHTFTPSTREVETGRFLWVPAQPGLHSDTTSWTTPAP